MRAAHIVIATVGSLGDLFPFLAVGQALRERGHDVTIATHAIHRETVERAGLRFADASGMAEPEDRAAFTARAFHRWRGPRFVVHDFAAMDVCASYRKLAPVCDNADVLITTTLAFAGQILGEQGEASGSLRWLSAVLAPAGFLSGFDPPATGLAALDAFVRRSPRRGRAMMRLAERITHPWTAPVRTFRRELGMPRQSSLGDPFHRGQHAPRGVLALYPSMLGKPQPDWPPNVQLTGFARYRQSAGLDDATLTFLDTGPPPTVFTLGSAAVHAGASFLRESFAAAIELQQRAVLLTGSPQMRANLPTDLPSTIHAVEYAPHAALFPRASVIVHHGGIGTSAEALRAGKPMLVVPHGFDQPDNAARLKRLGVAEVLSASRYRRDRAAKILTELLGQDRYQACGERAATILQRQCGSEVAADFIEATCGLRAGIDDGE